MHLLYYGMIAKGWGMLQPILVERLPLSGIVSFELTPVILGSSDVSNGPAWDGLETVASSGGLKALLEDKCLTV